jgi:tetratricopeptide (TPR) repeat protein
MRLGALTGKHHLKVLRELNDAMQTYERLRQKLNAHSEPIFRQLLTDLARVLDKFETDRGREIMKATEQVARLCDNALLTRQLLRLQAQLKFLEGDHVRALGFQRQLMLHPLAGGEIVNDENLQTVYRLVLTLHTLNQHAEALRVCDAAIALMPPEAKDWPFYPMLAFMRGRLKAELGDLIEGLSIMVQHAPSGNERLQRALKFWLTGHLLRAGLLSRKDAFAYGEDMSPKGVMLLDFACAMEDPAYLKQACDFALDEKQAKLGDLSRPPLYGPILLRAMTRHDKHAPAEFKSMLPKFVDDYAALPEIFTCQLWRMLENRKAARAEFEAAQARLNALPKGRWVDVLTRAIHHKNALWLGANETSGPLAQARDKAKTFFEEHIAKGFVCLKGLPS